jgi:hypothetical protein
MSRVQALCDLIVLIFRRCSERQGLTLVHFPPQPELFLTQKHTLNTA